MRRSSSRFHTYAVEVGAVARAYMDAVMALPAWGEWRAAALKEPWVLPEDEVGLADRAAGSSAMARSLRSLMPKNVAEVY